MRKFITIISALLLVLILSQCKKKPVVTDNGPEPISITLNVAGGSKVYVNTGTGEVAFGKNDIIYVASHGVYVGTLIHNGTSFTGTITNATENEPLYFYFLGNRTPNANVVAGVSGGITVDIIDQTIINPITKKLELPVISAGTSRQKYPSEDNIYTAILENKCALVKFKVTTPSTSPIYITGMKNRMQVTFKTDGVGTFTPNKVGAGFIKLEAGAGTDVYKWAILLEQNALPEGGDETAYSSDWEYTGTRGAVPGIELNMYDTVTAGIPVTVNSTENQGQLCGVFSVSSTKTVKISKGNLRYHTTSEQWSFHETQYDMVHYEVTSDVSGEYADNSGYYIDFFGWGTSGYNHGAVSYKPYSISGIDNEYYAYGNSNYNLYDSDGSADWGRNAIINGGSVEGKWHTLNDDEWNYLLNERSVEYRFAKGKVAGFPGLIIFPDDWDSDLYTIRNVNSSAVNYNSNKIPENQWNNILEPNGAVFLPAAGYRKVAEIGGVQVEGNYWSSNICDDSYSYTLTFGSGTLNATTASTRSRGRSVRLVCDVE